SHETKVRHNWRPARKVMTPITEVTERADQLSRAAKKNTGLIASPPGERDKGKPAERRGRKAFEANARACRRAPCRSGCRTYHRGSSCAPAAAGGPASA